MFGLVNLQHQLTRPSVDRMTKIASGNTHGGDKRIKYNYMNEQKYERSRSKACDAFHRERRYQTTQKRSTRLLNSASSKTAKYIKKFGLAYHLSKFDQSKQVAVFSRGTNNKYSLYFSK